MNGNIKKVLDVIARDDADFEIEAVIRDLPDTIEEQLALLSAIAIRNGRELGQISRDLTAAQKTHTRLYWIGSFALGCAILGLTQIAGFDVILSIIGASVSGLLAMLLSKVGG